MNQDFDWSLVRSFLAALDRGSLLGAARALNASQPTIGRHIAELESQLGVVLFERTGRGLLPSDAALRLAESARAMEGAALKLARSATLDQSGISGSVRISASQPVACVLLPPLLAQMRSVLPDVQVDLVVSNAVSNLLRREADIALRMLQPDQATLVARRVGKVALGVYAHRDYLRRHGTPRQPMDLLSHALVGYDQSPGIIEGFASYGLRMQRENFALRSDDLIAHCEAVRAGLGIGFLANYVAQTDKRLVALLPMLKLPTLPVWLVVHREIRTNQRIRKVFDFLASAVPAALAV